MIYLLISALLLQLGAGGHSISKLEINNTNTDVYEIKEDSSSNTIAFVNPKTEQQTLREIVYYHLVERPYGQSEGPTKLIPEEGPDFDDTERPFTNSHGFPFLASAEQGPNDDFDTEDLKQSLRASQEPAKETPLLIDEGEEEVIYYYDEDIEENSPDANKGFVTTQALEKPGEKTEIREIATTTPEPHNEEQTALPDNDEAVTATPPVAEDLETKARFARKLLFESAKERYHKNDNTQVKSPTSVRRKREISMHIPEGPRLGPLNLDSLPPYLRNLISTEEPQPRSRNYAPDSSEEERMEEIHRKMKDIMSKSRKEKKEESQPAPRTYGMNLTEDHGYVWNNINPESGFHFTVEASESIEVDETSEVNDKENPTKDDNGYQEESEESPEPNDSFEEKHKDESKFVENNTEDDVKPKQNTVEDDSDKSHEKYEDDKDKPINVDNEEDKDLTSEDKDASFEEKSRKRKPPKEREDTIDELLESEQFWSWLTDWTSAYLDVLTEHIEEAVQAEVENQMKSYKKSHKKKNKKPVKEAEKPKLDAEPSQKDNQTTTKHIKDENTTKIETKIEKEQKPATNQTLDTQKEEDLSQKQKKGDTKKPDANNIEGKVEPFKNSTKEENTPIKKDPKESTKIQAENLYGNSVGSEQVTNIFIFYPNKDINKIVEEIKNNTNITNVFETPNIDKRINVPDKNEKDAVETSSKAPTEVTDITTDAPIATNETPKVDEDDSSTRNTMDVTTKTPEETTEKPSSSKMPETADTKQNPSEITSTTKAILKETSHESNEESEIDNPDVDSDTNIDEGSIEEDNSPTDKTDNDNKENTNSDNASGNEQTTLKTEDKESSTIEANENEDASDKSDSKEKIETSTEPA